MEIGWVDGVFLGTKKGDRVERGTGKNEGVKKTLRGRRKGQREGDREARGREG